MFNEFLQSFIKFFFIITPFVVLTFFLAFGQGMTEKARKRLALRVTVAVAGIGLILLFFGNYIFSLLGITLDAFRIGAGSLLFLTAVSLVRGEDSSGQATANGDDPAVVPLAIPIAVGPGAIGVFLLHGAEVRDATGAALGVAALLLACLGLGALLYAASPVERFLGGRFIRMLSKVTGLILSALSAQIVFTGIRNFMGGSATGI